MGPFGFRCDWGRVTEITENKLIKLKWQISPDREPVPDPENASDLYVNFVQEENVTVLKFEHLNFENHGEGSADYKKIMDSKYGWDLILENFKKYCENA
ncbi:SRPBCC domain-containing protein [Cyclobacterium plantarum]|uniref:SRPBCC domain-containing protein n=1 Tax=Cyclobacterium plantarum TaxID=2716263 RepID=UPI003F7303F1